MKKLALVLVLVFVFALPVLANPFVDVPLNHWAYDSVQSLAAKGVIVGYPDGTFGGAKSLTRYEFAEATAKALAYVEGMDFASADDVAILEKLAIEFADELASLGVTVADLEASLGVNSEAIAALETTVAKLDTFFEPVKVSGSLTATFEDNYMAYDTAEGEYAINPEYASTLDGEVELDIVATINEKTTAGFTLHATGSLVTEEEFDVTADTFFIDFADGEYFAKLKVGDIASGDVGNIGVLGLVFNDEYEGVIAWDDEYFRGLWASWNLLGANFSLISEVDRFYTLKGQSGPIGAYVSLDRVTVTSADYEDFGEVIVGADLNYTFEDGVTDAKLDAAYQMGMEDYGLAGALSTKVGEDGEVGLAVDGHYIQAGFTPTAGNFDPNTMGGGASVSYLLDVAGLEKTEATLAYDYESDIPAEGDDAVVGTNEVTVTLAFTMDAVTEETATLEGTYEIPAEGDDAVYTVSAEYANYPVADKLKLSVYGEYSNTPSALLAEPEDYTYYGTLTLDYAYTANTAFQLEGRYDSDPAVAGLPKYSAYAEVAHTLATNTTLTVSYDLNDWDDGVEDGVGTFETELAVTF
ncbi:MAG: S-layer homology domain-containing protein [Atribacterota bacterium]